MESEAEGTRGGCAGGVGGVTSKRSGAPSSGRSRLAAPVHEKNLVSGPERMPVQWVSLGGCRATHLESA